MIPAGRVHDPSRTIPRATLIGTIVTAAIYIGVSAVPMLLIPQATLAASNAPFADPEYTTRIISGRDYFLGAGFFFTDDDIKLLVAALPIRF